MSHKQTYLPHQDAKAVGQMMTICRKEEGLKQSEVAARMGVSQARISQIENNGPRSVEQLCAYMNALGIPWELSKQRATIERLPLRNKPPKTAKGLLYGP